MQYLYGQCPGTSLSRILTGPMYGKLDVAFVKRIAMARNMRVEARTELFNVTNAINFLAVGPTALDSTTGMGSSVNDWQVTSAAQDFLSQDAGGRTTCFGLRFSW